MSTDRKRLTIAIQRIAKETPEIRKLLDEFRNSGGKPSESATSGSGAEDRQICCDGSSTGNANPGSGTRDPNENPQDGINPDDPAQISDNLTGVTDCATGDPICFEGSDWIPPEGWDGPTDPPVDDDFELGTYWAQPATGTRYYTASQGCEALGYTLGNCGPILSGTQTACECLRPNLTIAVQVRSYDCITTDTSDVCLGTDPPLEDAWPEDGCVNLAVKGGSLVGSKYDPENDGSWSAPRDEVELCDEFGNQFNLTGSSSGGWKTINPNKPDDGYLYDSTGKQIARISESEYSDPTM